MTLGSADRSWAYPECPRCKTDVLMGGSNSNYADYRCYGCGRDWDESDLEEA